MSSAEKIPWATHLEALERTDRLACLDGLSNRGAERSPVVERANSEEFDEGEDLFDIVLPVELLMSPTALSIEPSHLHRGAGEAPPELRIECTASNRCLRVAVLDVVSLIFDTVSALAPA